jgi:hypothetical protein
MGRTNGCTYMCPLADELDVLPMTSKRASFMTLDHSELIVKAIIYLSLLKC